MRITCCIGCGRDTKHHSGYCYRCRTGTMKPPPNRRTENSEMERPFSNYWEDMQATAVHNLLGYEYDPDE